MKDNDPDIPWPEAGQALVAYGHMSVDSKGCGTRWKKIMLCLMFRHEAEEAVKSYVSLFSPLFGDSKILSITYYGEDELEALRTVSKLTEDIMPGPAGSVRTIRFLLCGKEILAVIGGEFFGKFNESSSLYVSCDTQEQIDLLWMALLPGGIEQFLMGEPGWTGPLKVVFRKCGH